MISVMQTEQLERLSMDSKSPLAPCLLSINVTNIVKLPDKLLCQIFRSALKLFLRGNVSKICVVGAPPHRVGARAPPKI